MSKKSPVDSDNYYLYPEWFEGGNESNQSQPSTSSYSYPTLEYIWSNAVRLTRTTHSNLQDEIEYIEANLGGGGNESCNCSELEYKIDKNSTNIYYNSVNITSNANKIENLSDMKLSRDGSQPMEGELICNSGLKTDIIKAHTQSIVDCQNQLRVYQSLGGDGDYGLWLGSDFSLGAPSIILYPCDSSANGKIFIKTPRSNSISGPRVEIPGKNDFIDIKIIDSNIIPYEDNYQNLGNSSNRWKELYAVKNVVSYIQVLSRIWSNSTLKIGHGTPAGDLTRLVFTPTDISLGTPDSTNTLTYRVTLTGGVDNSVVYIKQAHLLPYTSSSSYLGASANRWARVYADKGIFSGTIVPDAIDSNTTKISNLSVVKLSRDGSQSMTGVLTCEAGLKTNSISTVSGDILTCDKDLVVNSHIWGNPLLTIGSGADFPDAYPHIEFSYNNLVLITPGESGPLERIYIYGGWDDGEIMIKNADLAPFTDNKWNLGFPGYTWRCVYAAKGNFSGTIVPDAILTNSANISDLDARVDYLEENLSTCNCSALQFGIDTNTTEIANLSTIKLSRDGSQTMTGSLKCEAGLKTNDIANLSDNELSIIGATPNNEGSQIKLTASRISLLTANSNGVFTERLRIPGGLDTVVVYIKDADFAPFHDNTRNLGYGYLRWKEICGYIGNFSSIEVKSHIWSNNTFRIGHGASATEDTKIRFTSNDLTLMTPNSNGTSTERIGLTGNADRSIVYIKNAHLLPYDNLSSYLGSSAHRWVGVFANRGSFTHISALSESTLDIEDDVKIAQKLWGKDNLILAGGDPATGHSQIQIYNESYIGLPDGIKVFTTNTSKELEERVRIWGNTDYCFIYFGSDVVPLDDDVYDLGGPSLRWSDIYAVNTHWGDLGFVENVCPKCNKKFKIGDNIVLKVVRFSEEDGGIMTIPIHLECAKLPAKTIKRAYPVKEKYYEWDERQGKVVAKWRTKKRKKKIKKKKLKSGYKINKKTGKIEAANRRKIDLSEAIEEVEEEVEEIVYQEKEIKI